jgi:hypothetical protein
LIYDDATTYTRSDRDKDKVVVSFPPPNSISPMVAALASFKPHT